MVSTFRGTLEFFAELGVYDVILPFLLVFTVVFAILEKTRVFGVDEIEGKKYPKKNLNAMAAFVMAFFVIASSELVESITRISSNMVVLLMLSVFFMILVGSFHKEDAEEGFYLKEPWDAIFMVIMFIGIIIIFLTGIETAAGLTWWDVFINWLKSNWNAEVMGSILMVLVSVGLIAFVTGSPGSKKNKKKEEE